MIKYVIFTCFIILLSSQYYYNQNFTPTSKLPPLYDNSPLISIYIHSGPALLKGRQLQRKHCFPLYKKYNISSTFVVARPSFDDRPHHAHAQGQHGTTKEHVLSEMLLNESKQYNDILLLQHRDYYRDMTDKMLAYFKHDYTHVKSKYVFKTDDEYCLNIPTILNILKKYKDHKKELYIGYYLWKGTEYKSMRGPHGEIAPFASGAALGVSRGLIKNIVIDNWDHSSMYHIYGTSSDDANLGKWILYAKQENNIHTEYVDGNIKYEIK